ncbi:rhodopsin, GQ-coupled-like [Colias croceus]|uniref:rhodopsin, GQ-coupled-like n=1 Tax=Colias crocea TaxID=72248 RepID=UPI001E27BA1A|nr:rhodopsin, GQ-coupled-like [Colias croceus]
MFAVNMSVQSCEWDNLFNDGDRSILKDGLVLTDSVSVLLGLWLNLTLLLTNLKYDLSYRNLAFFTLISCLRRGLSLCHSLLLSESWFDFKESCTFNGFWDTFLSVYEVECLTHVCIERYVVHKYINNGWEPIKWHYCMYQGLCLLFAALYSIPPLFGIGSYGLDFTCNSCTFDMVLPDSWQKEFIVLIFLLRSLKSGSFMIVMLYWAQKLEAGNKNSEKMMEQAPFTKSIIAMTAVIIMCWLPITMVRGSVVLSQLLNGYISFVPSVLLVQWSMWLSSISPAFMSITLFLVDDQIRGKALNFYKITGVQETKKEL